jgi:hypothetical protein
MANPREEKILAVKPWIAKMAKVSKHKSDGNSNERPNKKSKSDSEKPKKAEPSFMEHAPPKSDIVNPFEPCQCNNEPWHCCCKLAGGKCDARRMESP